MTDIRTSFGAATAASNPQGNAFLRGFTNPTGKVLTGVATLGATAATKTGMLGKLGHVGRGQNPTTIPTINGRKPINSGFAGQMHPSGVRFTERGFPDFTPFAEASFKIKNLTGNRAIDNRLANQAAGFGSSTSAPKGFVWHHVEDGVTMQLVPRGIHDAVKHTGGAAVIRNGGFDK